MPEPEKLRSGIFMYVCSEFSVRVLIESYMWFFLFFCESVRILNYAVFDFVFYQRVMHFLINKSNISIENFISVFQENRILKKLNSFEYVFESRSDWRRRSGKAGDFHFRFSHGSQNGNTFATALFFQQGQHILNVLSF